MNRAVIPIRWPNSMSDVMMMSLFCLRFCLRVLEL